MKYTNKYYELRGRLSEQLPDDYEKIAVLMSIYMKLRRLAKQHHRLAEYSCNGVGWIKGQCYYNGSIDDYAKRTYGFNVKSSYLDPECEQDIFNLESDKIQDKMIPLAQEINCKLEFQGDPRGYTVKMYDSKGNFIDWNWS